MWLRRLLLTSALLLSLLTLVPPAAAQDTSGWIYIARGNDIIAMRPDGSGAVNITQTPTLIERDPDVSNISGREMFVQLVNDQGQVGIRNLNLVSGGSFDNVPLQGQDIGEPSYGFDDSVLYLHFRRQTIERIEVFEATQMEVAGAGFERVYQPNGSPMSNDVFAYVAEVGGITAVRVNGPGVGDGAIGTNNGNGSYPSFSPDASFIVFTCGAQAQLCRADAVPGSTATVIPTPTAALNPAVSPQGDRVAWRDASGNVWVAGLDGSNPTQIANGLGGDAAQVGLDWGMDIPLFTDVPAEEPPPPPMEDPAPNTPLPPGATDFDPATTDRAEFSQPTPYSAAISGARFADAGAAFAGGLAQAQYAILGRDDNFADSLAGSPLTARGPLLYTPSTALAAEVATELQRVLSAGGTVYLLGGEVALSADVEQAVRDLGLTPQRLAGPSRFETASTVAAEVVRLGGSTEEVIVARGNGPPDNPTAAWADSVTGGVYAAENFVPVVITPSDSLHPAVQGHVDSTGATATLLGGLAALSQAVEDALPGSTRIAGASRADTAAMIATDLLDSDLGGPRAYLLFDGFSEDGWTFGLAAAGLGADLNAPLLVVGSTTPLPPETEALLAWCGDPVVETLLLGWEGVIDDSVRQTVDTLDGQACS